MAISGSVEEVVCADFMPVCRGSWAFLIGSCLQLYESLDTHPVEEVSSKEAFETTQ